MGAGAARRSKQARIIYSQAAAFVSRTQGLGRRFECQPGYPRILSRPNGGEGIRIYASDKDAGEGIIPTLCLLDELHVQKDLGLYRTCGASTASVVPRCSASPPPASRAPI